MGVVHPHGWPRRNLKIWSTAMNTPAWLCFLSAFSMWASGIALLLGFDSLAAAILTSITTRGAGIRAGTPFIAPDPYQIPEGDYAGPMGVGEPPSWEKASMYVVMCLVLMFCGGGFFSLDNLLIAGSLQA